jgi:hypothetical protein
MHGTQTLELHDDRIQRLLTFFKLDDDQKDAFLQWIALLGDGKTGEFNMKVVEGSNLEDRVLVLLGLFHEYMTAQKGVASITAELGGEEQLNAIGRSSLNAKQAVRSFIALQTDLWLV